MRKRRRNEKKDRLREETAFPVVSMVFRLAAVHSRDVNLYCRPHTIKQIYLEKCIIISTTYLKQRYENENMRC